MCLTKNLRWLNFNYLSKTQIILPNAIRNAAYTIQINYARSPALKIVSQNSCDRYALSMFIAARIFFNRQEFDELAIFKASTVKRRTPIQTSYSNRSYENVFSFLSDRCNDNNSRNVCALRTRISICSPLLFHDTEALSEYWCMLTTCNWSYHWIVNFSTSTFLVDDRRSCRVLDRANRSNMKNRAAR